MNPFLLTNNYTIMKRLLLFSLTVLMAALAAHADVTINATNFPDATFRSYLLSQYPSGTITTAQLNARDTLNLSYKGISNMTGVQYFTQLKRLDLYSNNLTSIDVSANTKLIYLNLGYNKLTSINVTSNTVLQELYLQNNQLTTVSVNNHSSLRTLWVRGNTTLTGFYCWRDALTNVDVTGCTALQYLKIYNNYNLTGIYGLEDCTNLTWLDVEDTSFSDLSAVTGMTRLETLLAGNTQISALNTSHSGSLKNLQVAGDTRLTQLICYSEDLTTLKVTGCTALSTLKCYFNDNLETITGLASCKALAYLDCEDCAITELPGVNDMTNLGTLWCRNNQLTGTLEVSDKPQLKYLRVSGNTGLQELRCPRNALISLDVTGCTALNLLHCEENSNLSSIQGLTDCTALAWFGCDYCAFTSLDVTFSPRLHSLYCYNNQLTSLNVTGLTSLLTLNCKNNPDLGSITGLSDCSAVTYFECSDCGLDSLDVGHMNDLGELWCSNNLFTTLSVINKPQLTALVANDNPFLEQLECYSCALTRLDVSNCPVLDYIDCEENQLTELDVTTCPALVYFLCSYNQLTELDISRNSELLYLWCQDNQLTSVDLSTCPDAFLSLDCRSNQVSGTIDVSRFANLIHLLCNNNQISQVVLGNHDKLIYLWVAANQLTSLDASGCTALQTLRAQTNQLTSLPLGNCPDLNELPIFYNQINATKMGEIVDALPMRSADNRGILYAIIDYNPEDDTVEGNVITAAQVSQANAKNWDVYHWSWAEGEGWEPYVGSSFQRGDVNDDGSVNISDVTALIDLLLGGGTISNPAADANQDGNVNISDVTALIDYLLAGNWPSKVMRADTGVSTVGGPHFVDSENIVLEKPQHKRH